MEKIEITSRPDIKLLVHTFYGKIRLHPVLGPIFNSIVTDWPTHLDLLTDFWETQLLFERKYRGNPLAVHQEVDEKMDHSMKSEHFGIWLNLWFETLDELFQGDTAQIAKNRARKMSTMLYLNIFENRKK
ncbi:group III truncated hemoglobin [Flavobacteriaceae bacterium F89]|uniref:Group III truncated hemoglobin n=1 Tax=Cerina litoralis TaxID=2874477 RepID=A0AAE3EV37_9FLAO|nr:group III truncated hemoglobin [Cerina litoralis]MCG2460689.1 group III truncated hemoglobin [Cerina litoralis]